MVRRRHSPEEPGLNYRHDFHAGNFADLLKHAVWLELLDAMTREQAPLHVVETHAGAGLYDLAGVAAGRSREALSGIERLLTVIEDAPAPLRRLAEAVARVRRRAGAGAYPGSPLLAAAALRAGDRYTGWELREEDAARLSRALAEVRRPDGPVLEARCGDGYLDPCGPGSMRRLVMIDPPFERPDEGRMLTACAGRLVAGGAATAIWAPLKDLDGFDRLLEGLEAVRPRRGLAVELRLRPLHDPLRLNGCAMILLDTPDVEAAARAAGDWLARTLGEAGAEVRLHRFGATG